MALYKGTIKLDGVESGFLPENSGNIGQVLKKTATGYNWANESGGGGGTYTAGEGINIDANNEISNTLPGPTISSTAPSSPIQGMEWYDTTNNKLKVYDGTNWNVVGDDAANINTKTFYLSSTSDLTNAQAALDWILSGKDAVLIYDDRAYLLYKYQSGSYIFIAPPGHDTPARWASYSASNTKSLWINYSGTSVISITDSSYDFGPHVLETDYNYPTPYTPTYAGSPATKKYVDDNVIQVGATAPSSPTEGMVWYDTTNDVLKSYDGTNWQVTGKEYNAGEGISIGDVQDYSAMQGPCPNGYHIPLKTEMEALLSAFSSLGYSGATSFETYLKMPEAGRLTPYNAGAYDSTDSGYRTSSPSGWMAREFNPYVFTFYQSYTTCGYSIRPFKDIPVEPDNTWTLITTGIYHNSTLGLISISGDGTTWITIADKNLGATTVYNYGDTISAANCGGFFQWGNNYMFPMSGAETTDYDTVDASGYGPGNYYLSSTFHTDDSWDSSENTNLRGGVTGVVTTHNAISNTGVLSINGQTGNVTNFYIVDTLPDISQANTESTYYLSIGNDEYEEWIVVEQETPHLITFDVDPVIEEQYIPSEVTFTEPTTLTFYSKTGSGRIEFDDGDIYVAYGDAGEVTSGGDEGWYHYNRNIGDFVYDDATSYTFPAGTYTVFYWASYATAYDTISFTDGPTITKEWAKVGSSSYVAGTGINITNNTISVDNTVAMASDMNTKTFYLSSTSDLTNAQAAYDWYLAGKNPIIIYSNKAYSIVNHFSTSTTFAGLLNTNQEISNSYTLINYPEITLNHSNNTVTSISIGGGGNTNVLRVDYNYSTPYTPLYNGSPATKKYVDDRTFTGANGGVKVFSDDDPISSWNVSSALAWRNAGGQVIFRRSFLLEGVQWDAVYYVSYWDPDNKIIHLISFTDGYGAGPEKHIVTYDASGNVTNVTTTSLGLQVSPNSTITGIKYVWYGTEADYANLNQYYTDVAGDTEFHTF